MAGGTQLLLLDDLARCYEGHDLASLARSLLIQPNGEKRAAGLIFRAGVLYQHGETMAALSQLLGSRKLLGLVPLPVIANIVWLAQKMGREQTAAWECFYFARDAFRMGYPNLGMEAVTAAFILDGMARFELIRSPGLLCEIGQQYVLSSVDAGLHAKASRRPLSSSGPLHLALIVPNLVDHVVAYTQRTLQFARYLDRNTYRMSVYVSENLSARENPGFPFGCTSGTSETTGKHTLHTLENMGVPVHLMSRHWSCMEAGRQLARRLDADQVDIALFQSGMACPIDWLAAHASAVPIKAGIHIGTSYYGAGLDLLFVDNPENIRRETNWDEKDGVRIIRHKGVDLALADAAPPLPRARWRIPSDAILIGTLSNHLDKRLSPDYLALIARLMRRHEKVWFVPIGSEEIPAVQAFFAEQGLAARVRFPGRQLLPAAALKMLDVYAGEFPVGGSQSVMEAMACALPVVAMKYGDAHAESVAAELVGEPHAIPHADLSAYEQRLEELICRPPMREEIGRAMRLRAEQHFAAPDYVRDVLDICLEHYRARTA